MQTSVSRLSAPRISRLCQRRDRLHREGNAHTEVVDRSDDKLSSPLAMTTMNCLAADQHHHSMIAVSVMSCPLRHCVRRRLQRTNTTKCRRHCCGRRAHRQHSSNHRSPPSSHRRRYCQCRYFPRTSLTKLTRRRCN